jgi:hypothetical protein
VKKCIWKTVVASMVVMSSCSPVTSKVISVSRTDLNGRGVIMGRVVEAETGEPLPYASVRLVSTESMVVTNQNGEYKLIDVPPGLYNVKASLWGFEVEEHKKLHVGRDSTIILNFYLRYTVIRLEDVI